MADNVAITAGSGTTIATDDVGGVQYQRVKVVWGADGAVNDTAAAAPLPVVQTGALPAGTNAIGKLAANSGVDIGDVDVLSVVPGTAATNLGKAEDAAHSSGDVGVMALAVQKTTAAALGADGDYEPFEVNAEGRLYTIPDNGVVMVSVTPTITAGAEHAGDNVGGEMEFASAVSANGKTCIVDGVVVFDKLATQLCPFDLVLAGAAIVPGADNAAFSPDDAHGVLIQSVIPISSYCVGGANAVASRDGLGVRIKPAATSIFGTLVARANATWGSTSDLTVTLKIVRDA